MPTAKATKTRGGYKVSFGPYETTILVKKSNGNSRQGIHATTKLEGKAVAHIDGTTLGELASISKISSTTGLSREATAKALGIIVPSVELALKKTGINHVSTSTHPTTARIFKQMGYAASGRGTSPEREFIKFLKHDMGYKIPMRSTITDLRKNLAKRQPKFVQRIRPVTKKATKKLAPKKHRRR